jgi:malonyl-CoA O-methyltransferase
MSSSLSWLRTEIQQRMLDKLAPIKLIPKRILIEPDFEELNYSGFAKRFSQALIDTLDHGHQVSSRSLIYYFNRLRKRFILGSGTIYEQSVPEDAQFDLIVSNLYLQNLSNLDEWFQKIHHHTKQGGLICFSYLGPDTGKELKKVTREYLRSLPGALDMHDIGDALVKNRFSDPVMDMEYLHLEYESDQAMFRDGQALGLINSQALFSEFEAPSDKKITLEIVYGHAWVLSKNLSSGDPKTAYIRPDAIKRK